MTKNIPSQTTLRVLANRPAPPAETVFLRRVTFGIAPAGHYAPTDKGDLVAFRAGGSNLTSRVNAWVDKQLNIPSDVVKTDITNRISNSYRTIGLTVSQEWDRFLRRRGQYKSEPRERPLIEAEYLSFQRSIYSKYQLFERLAMFWHDHFSVYGYDFYPRCTWGTWDKTIRTGVMGNFYQFLLSTAEHPAMLYYLDNYSNSRSGPNENYARELLELHTLGAMNYVGLKKQKDVDVYTARDNVPSSWVGAPKGYVDADVYEATRVLTGWHVDDRDSTKDTGEFVYRSDEADQFQKRVLGHEYDANGNGDEYKDARFGSASDDSKLRQGRHMLWRLATHPGTARHIAWKLVRHFISDTPPEAAVSAVAKTFLDNADRPDQLKRCYQTLFKHPAMRDTSTWGEQKARPTEMVIHACRVMGCQRDFRPYGVDEKRDDPLAFQAQQSGTFVTYYMSFTGHRQFHWRPPNGYPQDASYWLSSNSMVQTWKTIEKMAEYYSYNFLDDSRDHDVPLMTILPITLKQFPDRAKQTPRNIVKFWATRVWGFTPSDAELEPILTFFCAPTDEYGTVVQPWGKDFPISDGRIDGKTIDSNTAQHRWWVKLRLLVAGLMTHPYAMIR